MAVITNTKTNFGAIPNLPGITLDIQLGTPISNPNNIATPGDAGDYGTSDIGPNPFIVAFLRLGSGVGVALEIPWWGDGDPFFFPDGTTNIQVAVPYPENIAQYHAGPLVSLQSLLVPGQSYAIEFYVKQTWPGGFTSGEVPRFNEVMSIADFQQELASGFGDSNFSMTYGADCGLFIVFTMLDPQAAPSYGLVVTTVGQQKIAQKILNGQKLIIDKAAIDDGGGIPFTPNVGMTALNNEVWRGGIAAAEVSGNTIHVLVTLDSNVGNFTARGVGIFDEENDLIAVGNLPDTEKAASTSGADMKLKILSHLIVTDGSVIEVVVNPVLNTVDWEQLQAALEGLGDSFTGDLNTHIADPNTHMPIQQKFTDALNLAKQQLTDALMPKKYGTTSGNKYCYYTLYPDGSIVGGGYTNAINSNGDNFILASCGKTVTRLDATASCHVDSSVGYRIDVKIQNLNTYTPEILVDDDGTDLFPRRAFITFTGRVNMGV